MSPSRRPSYCSSMDELTWVADQDLRVTALSRRLRELLGPTLATNGDLPIARLFLSDDPFQIASVAHEWAREGEPVDFETKWHDGTYHISLQPLHGVTGAIVGVLGTAREKGGALNGNLQARIDVLHEAEALSGLGSWHTDLRTGKTVWSRGLCSLLGIEEQRQGETVREFDHPEDADTVRAIIDQAERGTRYRGYRCEHRILRGDGQIRYVQEQVHLQYDRQARAAISITGSMLDITERKISESRLRYLAHYDTVSNLPNRALLEERLAASMSRAQHSGRLCALLFLDIDAFKSVNDDLGHAAGDELLAAVGLRLQRHVRANDTVARIGGDEFVIVLDNLANNHEAHEGARKILAIFNEPFGIGGTRRHVSASIGVSIYPFTAATPVELIHAADAAMYIVKKNGGAGFEPARPQVPGRDTSKVHAACANSSVVKHRSVRGESGLASG